MSSRHPYHDKSVAELLTLSVEYVAELEKLTAKEDKNDALQIVLLTKHLDWIFWLIAKKEAENGS